MASLPRVLTRTGGFGVPARPIHCRIPVNFSPDGFNRLPEIILQFHSFFNSIITPTGIILRFFSKERPSHVTFLFP